MTNASYFKIGAFVVFCASALVAFLILLGIGSVFKHYTRCETYFDESVQGLEVGSPVMFRGVRVGEVENILLVSNVYENHSFVKSVASRGYVYVEFKISPQAMGHDISSTEKSIKDGVEHGMRVTLATQGLVGTTYLEITMVNPKINPPLPHSWKPYYAYIPSAKSHFTRLRDHIEHIFTQLNKIKFAEIGYNMNTVFKEIGDITQTEKFAIKRLIQNTAASSANIRHITTDAKQNPSRLFFGKPPTDWENQR